jgi:hypothetical protein
MKNLMDLSTDLGTDKALLNEFLLQKNNSKKLGSWLKEKGYNATSSEVNDIVSNVNQMSRSKTLPTY